jgi:hypothetical protein
LLILQVYPAKKRGRDYLKWLTYTASIIQKSSVKTRCSQRNNAPNKGSMPFDMQRLFKPYTFLKKGSGFVQRIHDFEAIAYKHL